MIRDFSEEQKQRLLDMVKEVQPDNVFSLIEDWLDDMFHILKGGYRINDYLRDISTHHKKMIDMENISAKRIIKIFDDVRQVDENYRSDFSSKNNAFNDLRIFISRMSECIHSGGLTLSHQDFLKTYAGTVGASAEIARTIGKPEKVKTAFDFPGAWNIIDNVFLDGVPSVVVPAVARYLRAKNAVPNFVPVPTRPGIIMIKDSEFFHGGRMGSRYRNLNKMLEQNSELAKKYNLDQNLKKAESFSKKMERTEYIDNAAVASISAGGKARAVWENINNIKQIAKNTKIGKVGWGFSIASGVITAASEYAFGDYNTQQERVVGSVVEGGFAVGSAVVAMKVGAIAGTVAGPLGTVAGAAIGFAVGVGVGCAVDALSNWEIINGKSIKDVTKDAINSTINSTVNFAKAVAAPAIGNAISNVGNGLRDIGNNISNGLFGIGNALFAH